MTPDTTQGPTKIEAFVRDVGELADYLNGTEVNQWRGELTNITGKNSVDLLRKAMDLQHKAAVFFNEFTPLALARDTAKELIPMLAAMKDALEEGMSAPDRKISRPIHKMLEVLLDRHSEIIEELSREETQKRALKATPKPAFPKHLYADDAQLLKKAGQLLPKIAEFSELLHDAIAHNQHDPLFAERLINLRIGLETAREKAVGWHKNYDYESCDTNLNSDERRRVHLAAYLHATHDKLAQIEEALIGKDGERIDQMREMLPAIRTQYYQDLEPDITRIAAFFANKEPNNIEWAAVIGLGVTGFTGLGALKAPKEIAPIVPVRAGIVTAALGAAGFATRKIGARKIVSGAHEKRLSFEAKMNQQLAELGNPTRVLEPKEQEADWADRVEGSSIPVAASDGNVASTTNPGAKDRSRS